MNPINTEALEEAPARCEFAIGENKIGLEPAARCVREAGHEEVDHVIAAPARDSATFWSIEPGERVAKALMHVDLRDGSVLGDEEAYALWVYMELLRERTPPT